MELTKAERDKQCHLKWRTAHRGELTELAREWRKANPEKYRAQNRRAYIKRRAAHPKVPRAFYIPHHTHGMSKSREYTSYICAKQRCNNPRTPCYANYGGRGIRFLFTSFEQFFAELGPRPPGTSLDRIDVNGNYEPKDEARGIAGCKWATRFEQTHNRRPLHGVDGFNEDFF
jgi:hypothetical protein